jgi:hypothetical protein
MVELYNTGVTDTNSHNCGATLIHTPVLLTAAHCYADGDVDFPDKSGLTLKNGNYQRLTDRSLPPIGTVDTFEARNWAVGPPADEDVLLIRLQADVSAQPVRIGSCPSMDTTTQLGFLGWGSPDAGEDKILDECITHFRDCSPAVPGHLCTTVPPPACYPLVGDSGGPVFINGTNSA